jgi:hypothetical protein
MIRAGGNPDQLPGEMVVKRCSATTDRAQSRLGTSARSGWVRQELSASALAIMCPLKWAAAEIGELLKPVAFPRLTRA